MLCSTTSDSECAALFSTTRPADTNPYFGCQQGRLVELIAALMGQQASWCSLLLFRAGRCLRSSTGQAAVHPQRCCPTHVLSQGLRTHHPSSPRPSLVAGPGTDAIPSLRSGIRMSQRDQRRHISLTAFVGQPMWKVVNIYHHDACCPISAAINSWRPCLSCRCITGMETAYHSPSEPCHPSASFGNNCRHICLGSVLANFSLPSSLLL